MKTTSLPLCIRENAGHVWLALSVLLLLTLAKAQGAGASDRAEIDISGQVTWTSSTSWSKELKDSDNKPYQVSINANENVHLENNVKFQMQDGSWEPIESPPNISVNGSGTYKMTGKDPINKSVTTVAQEPLPTNAMVHLHTLDFEEGYAILTVSKPATTSQPDCLECGFIAILAIADCLSDISTNNPSPEEYRLEFPPGHQAFTVTRSFSWSQSGGCGSASIQATFTIRYTPGKWEAVILPPSDFDKWKPTGGVDEDNAGGSVGVNVQIRHKGETEPATDITGTFGFKLENVSRQPGVCVNAPPSEKAKIDPDLRLAESDSLMPTDDDGQSAESTEEANEQSVTIDCYDFGAYGRLRVEVVGDDGTTVQAHLESDPGKDYLDIPVDDNGNHIADVWEKENAVPEGLPPTWDEAALPAGQRTLGDGISLYEKYRGFFIKGNHQRLDPHRKQLFIYDPTGWAEMCTTDGRGISFAKALDCDVHFIEDTQWTGPGGSGAKKRTVNFNSTDEVHATDQHALHVRFPFTDSPLYPADYNDMLKAKYGTNDTQSVNAFGLTFPDLTATRWSSPIGWLAVEVYVNNIEKWTQDAVLFHTMGLPEFAHYNDPGTTAAERARLDALAKTLRAEYITAHYDDYELRNWKIFTAITTHEVGHGVGIKDLNPPNLFGPSNCVMRYFQLAGTRLPNDRFELARRVPWPDRYCLDPTGTQEGIACWGQISVSDRQDAPVAAASLDSPAAGLSARPPISPMGLNPSGNGSQTTQMVKPPNLALSTELIWDDLVTGDPLRLEIHLTCPAYREAFALAQSTGQAMPTNVFQPTISTNWAKHLNFFLYYQTSNHMTQLLSNNDWQTFLRAEAVRPSSFVRNPPMHTREWLIPTEALALQPGEYSLSVFWNGDETVESSALPPIGFVSANEIRFQVIAPTNSLQKALHEHRLAFANYAGGNFQAALDHALLALGQNDTAAVLQFEGTHMLAANASIKVQDYRTAAVLLQEAAQIDMGEGPGTALALRRILTPEILLDPNASRTSLPRLTVIVLPGQSYEVQASTDLSRWLTLDRRLAATNRYEVVDNSEPGSRQRFYRVVWLKSL